MAGDLPGDPRTGNAAWAHLPLRLLIVAYARPEKISQVLSDHPAVAQLFANGWARLACIDPGTLDTLLLDQTLVGAMESVGRREQH